MRGGVSEYPAIVIPKDTTCVCSQDWGFNAPGVILWWCALPDGHWHIAQEYRSQYTSAEDVAKEWKTRTRSLGVAKVSYVAADPSMWAKTGHGKGESIAETLQRFGMPMVRSDNDRKNGWQRCHELLRLAPDGVPWVTVDATCTYGLRSLPAQVSDKTDPDDVDTGGDDHWVDAFRYGAMSRLIRGGRTTRMTAVAPYLSMGWVKAQQARESSGLLARRRSA